MSERTVQVIGRDCSHEVCERDWWMCIARTAHNVYRDSARRVRRVYISPGSWVEMIHELEERIRFTTPAEAPGDAVIVATPVGDVDVMHSREVPDDTLYVALAGEELAA